jgi:hypothetical protein
MWRCVDTTSSQTGRTPSILKIPSTPMPPIDSHNSDLGSSPEGRELGQYRSLALRVGELEWLFQHRVLHNAGSLCSCETNSERPLAFLRQKVGMELKKSLGGTVASARKHTEAHAVVQLLKLMRIARWPSSKEYANAQEILRRRQASSYYV